ncbi:hypothetical protein [Nitrosospira sp. Is2]|uniref:hypothetical protein n=1 Tax=Nitrosospira sp. Is2 TaxID=3080532 RepID=UPI0029546179|nr:hypothetical protein [Nitrosospira sp. Is2]WON73715.1 hypothetical protein R5L00_14730 [Nitrosospira sp. Is2]
MDKLTPDDAFELGNQFRDAAILLGDWRIRNRSSLTKAEWDVLDGREIRLLNMASSIYTTAVGLVLMDSQTAVVHLQFSVKAAKSAVQHIATLKQALDLASALILFAAAVSSGNAAAIPAAIVAVNDAATAIVERQGGEGA